MAFSKPKLKKILARTNSLCHLCGARLYLKNHGKSGARGAWHVDHSKAKAKGGTDWLQNYLPACISCNCSKGTKDNRTLRKKNGLSGKPPSKAQVKLAERKQTGALSLGTVGLIAGGPAGAVIGAVAGWILPEVFSST